MSKYFILMLAAVALFAATAHPQQSQPSPPPTEITTNQVAVNKTVTNKAAINRAAAKEGKPLFVQFCTACHGTEGKGDGPLSLSLSQHPANLTQLAYKNGGQYPEKQVEAIILNGPRSHNKHIAHGSTDMPAWSSFLGTMDQTDQQLKQHMIYNLSRYIETLQSK